MLYPILKSHNIHVFILTDKQEQGNYSIENETEIINIFKEFNFNIHFLDYIENYENLFDHNTRESNKGFILANDIIMIDIDPHNGILEYDMYIWLKKNDYKGLILFDDIHLGLGHIANNYNPTTSKMSDFWNKIEDKYKIDLTSIGHWSGTGLVSFNFEKYTILYDNIVEKT